MRPVAREGTQPSKPIVRFGGRKLSTFQEDPHGPSQSEEGKEDPEGPEASSEGPEEGPREATAEGREARPREGPRKEREGPPPEEGPGEEALSVEGEAQGGPRPEARA